MNGMKYFIMTLMICVLLIAFPQSAFGQDVNDIADHNDVDSVIIALTRLDVNDLILDVNEQITDVNEQTPDPNGEALNIDRPTLELRWMVKNNSDQDVWICESVGFIEDEFEVFMEDDQTLLIRRRLDVPTIPSFYIWPEGQYVRLRSGDEMVKSLSIILPVHTHWIFWPKLGEQDLVYARRLVLEIGYHTKDLVQIILDLKDSDDDPNLYNKAIITYLHSANEGEHVLRITVDGVLIPYEDVWVQDPHGNADAME